MRSVLEIDLSYRLRASEVLSMLPLRIGSRGIDLGCATGAFAAELAHRGISVACVDDSSENLAALSRLYPELVADGRLEPIRADVTAVPYPDASFDFAFCMEVLEHVDNDGAAARELARLLVPGGMCAISVPNVEAPPPLIERVGIQSVHQQEGVERHVRAGYSARTLEALLRSAGLDAIELSTVGGAAYRLVAGLVSLGHLARRRACGQTTWTWADVEADTRSPILRVYRLVFPALLRAARIGSHRGRGSTLVAIARRPG